MPFFSILFVWSDLIQWDATCIGHKKSTFVLGFRSLRSLWMHYCQAPVKVKAQQVISRSKPKKLDLELALQSSSHPPQWLCYQPKSFGFDHWDLGLSLTIRRSLLEDEKSQSEQFSILDGSNISFQWVHSLYAPTTVEQQRTILIWTRAHWAPLSALLKRCLVFSNTMQMFIIYANFMGSLLFSYIFSSYTGKTGLLKLVKVEVLSRVPAEQQCEKISITFLHCELETWMGLIAQLCRPFIKRRQKNLNIVL